MGWFTHLDPFRGPTRLELWSQDILCLSHSQHLPSLPGVVQGLPDAGHHSKWTVETDRGDQLPPGKSEIKIFVKT